jgi:VWFA-related protein
MLRGSTSKWIYALVPIVVTCAAATAATVSRATAEPVQSQAPRQAIEADVWLFFIDDLHLDFKATGRLRDMLRRVFGQLVQEGDLVGVVSTASSSIAIDLTRDRGRLAVAIDRFSGAALKPSEIVQRDSRSEVGYRAHVAFDTAFNVLKMLDRAPGQRKAFIYISNGYEFDIWPGTPRSDTNPFSVKGSEISLERLRAEVAELTSQAKRSHVTIYGIDPRALSGPPTIDPNVDEVVWQRYWTTTRHSLDVIAEDGGGFVIQDDLDEGLNRILNAMRL